MNMTNTICGIPCWDFFCREHVGTFMEAYFDEVDLGRIALSCHFALDVLCDKAEVQCPEARSISALLPSVRSP